MCGIAGLIGAQGGPRAETLLRMAAMLRHRGPDGYGLYLDDHVGLAHTRLSIIDLAGGAQPLCNEGRTIWISFNGEIFNYVELKADLESRGHRFATRSDTEVIVHAFEEWGPRAWKRFNGQFAFALWDSRQRQLWLVRDRVGILPLFYARTDRGTLFGSEAKALFASGLLAPRLDPAGIARVFSMWASPPPGTVFEGVRGIEPGTAMMFEGSAEPAVQRYWSPEFRTGPDSPRDSSEAAERLGEVLAHSVRIRLRADVPVGAYLSGGLDSSVIASLVHQAQTTDLQTFSLRFEDAAYDETPAQRRMAALLGTRHHEILCGPAAIGDTLPKVVWHCETPLLRTGPVPMSLLSGLVRQNGMKVVLTGEGADEFLAGYDIFKENKIRRFWAREPDSTVRPALLSRIHAYIRGGGSTSQMWREYFRTGLTEVNHPFYSHRLRWTNASWTTRFLSPEVRAHVPPDAIDPALLADLAPRLPKAPLSRAQAIELATFMGPYLLASQGDRVAMGNSIETRYPYLDPDVMDLAESIPPAQLLCGLRDKLPLRRFASRSLPREIWDRPKWPYRAPISSALFGARTPEYVRELLSPTALARSAFIDAAAASALVSRNLSKPDAPLGEREQMALVGLLTLQLLSRDYLETFDSTAAGHRRGFDGSSPDVVEDRRTRPADPAPPHRRENPR